jgi:hypothetical protein
MVTPLLLEEDCEGDGARGKAVLKGKGSRHWGAVAAVGWAGIAAGRRGAAFGLTSVLRERQGGGGRVISGEDRGCELGFDYEPKKK